MPFSTAAKSRGDVERHDVDSIMSRSTADEDGDGDDPSAAALRAYAFNSRALPLLHQVVGILNNLQAVAWREWLIHGACEQQGLNPADQALLSGVVCALNGTSVPSPSSRRAPSAAAAASPTAHWPLPAGGAAPSRAAGDAAVLPAIAATAVTGAGVHRRDLRRAHRRERRVERGAQVGKLQATCQLTAWRPAGTVLGRARPVPGRVVEAIFIARRRGAGAAPLAGAVEGGGAGAPRGATRRAVRGARRGRR